MMHQSALETTNPSPIYHHKTFTTATLSQRRLDSKPGSPILMATISLHRPWTRTGKMRAVPTRHCQSALERTDPSPRNLHKTPSTATLSERSLDRETRLADPHGNHQLVSPIIRRQSCGPDAPIRARKDRSIATLESTAPSQRYHH